MKQLSLIITLVLCSVILSGCTTKTTPNTPNTPSTENNTQSTGKCKTESVAIEGYGDKGKRLSNCFVEYPGEPSRQDKSYYIVEDLCGQFTPEFIGNALGKPIIKTEGPQAASLFNCTYYINETEKIFMNLEYLTIANQKKGYEEMGRTTAEEPKIPMRNLIVFKENNIEVSFLVLDDNKFISIRPPSGNTMSKDDFISFVAAIATEIKNYK
jgi:hypothetical protein